MKLNVKELEKWSNAFGPSGFERDVAIMVKEYLTPFADEISQDRTGSVIFKIGQQGPKVMLAGHIDEIGFIVAGISTEGFISFRQLGGWWDQTLLTQRVIIKVKDGSLIKGVICAKPPHLLKPEDRTKVVLKEDMFIDIGCKNKKEVENLGVMLGDPIIPDSTFEIFKRTQIINDEETKKETKKNVELAVGKGFDDRIGAFIIAEIFKRIKKENITLPNQLFGVATVQEEVGLRGAKTAAQIIEPDVGFALEVDISSDIPGIQKIMTNSEMSKGPSILTADSSMIPNPQLKHFIIDVAKEIGVELQLSMLFGGGTDAGVIHLTGAGCPSVCIAIPTRHIHSHYGILDLEDVEKCVTLLIEVIKRLDQTTVDSFTKI